MPNEAAKNIRRTDKFVAATMEISIISSCKNIGREALEDAYNANVELISF